MARDEHNKAAEHHENAAKSHRAAAENQDRFCGFGERLALGAAFDGTGTIDGNGNFERNRLLLDSVVRRSRRAGRGTRAGRASSFENGERVTT